MRKKQKRAKGTLLNKLRSKFADKLFTVREAQKLFKKTF